MANHRPDHSSASYSRDRWPHERPRSPLRRRLASTGIHKIGAEDTPWQFNSVTGDVLLNGRQISTWERNLALLATRYPDQYCSKGALWESFDKEDQELVRLVEELPLDLTEVEHSPQDRVKSAQRFHRAEGEGSGPIATTESTNSGERSPSTVCDEDLLPMDIEESTAATAMSDSTAASAKPARKPLPQIPTDRSPWTYDEVTGDIIVCGERLIKFERILVSKVNRQPDKFKESDVSIREGEKPLTGWERDLIAAARKFPIKFKQISSSYPVHSKEQAQPSPKCRCRRHLQIAPRGPLSLRLATYM